MIMMLSIIFLVLLTGIIIIYNYKKNWKYRLLILKELHKLHKGSIIEDFSKIEHGLAIELKGTGVYPKNGKLIVFEFTINIVNNVIKSVTERIEEPYNEKSFRHELITPEKKNHWREDQLLHTRNKNA